MSKSLTKKQSGNSVIKYDINSVQRILTKRQNKANEIIQNYRYNLPPYENKVLTYIVSHINWDDKDVDGIDINIHEFHALCDLAPPSGGKDFAYFGQAVNYLMNARIARLKEAESEDVQKMEVFSWLKNDFEVNIKNADFTVHLHDKVKGYFLDMQSIYSRTGNGYTSCYVSAIMRMKGLYSGRLYELLKSYLNLGSWTVSIDDLRSLITPKENPETRNLEKNDGKKKGESSRKGGKKSPNLLESYLEFKDFNKFVLKPAIAEINEKSDIYLDAETDVQKIRNSERKVVALKFTIHAKSKEEIEKIEEETRKDVERAKIIRDNTIAEDIKQQMLMQLDVMPPEHYTPSIIVNSSLSADETKKRYNIFKAISLRLGKDFKETFNGEYLANFDDVFDSFIDVIWDDVKEYGEKSPALEKVNELLQSLEMRTFVTAIVERYGTEAFWFNVEKDGKKVKYRNKYRKTAISNDLRRWEDFLFEGVDNNPFVGTTDQSKADIEPDLFNVPVFTKPE